MKKYLPVILFVLGALILVWGIFFLRGKNDNVSQVEDEESVPEIPFTQRPVVSLTPTDDGHYLIMRMNGLGLEAQTLDYEILYDTADGITQGVPGTAQLNGSEIERDILLGSESSGKFRYDEGVEMGTITLRFRNDKGKLVGKLTTQWHLQTNTDQLTSSDGNFSFTLSEETEAWFVTMSTFGAPDGLSGEPASGPYGVFGSDEGVTGTPQMPGTIRHHKNGEWVSVDGETSIGIFVGE